MSRSRPLLAAVARTGPLHSGVISCRLAPGRHRRRARRAGTAHRVGPMPSSDARALSEWVTAVARELGLAELDSATAVDLVLDLTSDVAHGVSRPAAPVTAFLVGVAAGRADDPARSEE